MVHSQICSKNKKKAEVEDYSDVKAGVDVEKNSAGGLWAIDERADDEPVEYAPAHKGF